MSRRLRVMIWFDATQSDQPEITWMSSFTRSPCGSMSLPPEYLKPASVSIFFAAFGLYLAIFAARALIFALSVMLTASLAGAPAAHAAYFDQYAFTGDQEHVFDVPGGQYGICYQYYKINVLSYYSASWVGGNVYDWNGQSTGYVLRQYTAYSFTYCT